MADSSNETQIVFGRTEDREEPLEIQLSLAEDSPSSVPNMLTQSQ